MSSENALSETVDFNVHGLVGVRLVDASPSDVAAVGRQLGPLRGALDREPEIVVRFAEDLPLASCHLLGGVEAGFTDDAFVVLRGKHKSAVRVHIPFDRIGGTCEIVCRSGLSAVPLLIAILNLTALEKGVLPLHASAFLHEGEGVLCTGWSKGGKTEALLAFMAEGATYVGDEWVYLNGQTGSMHGIPEPVRVWDWHLRSLPTYKRAVRTSALLRMSLTRSVQRCLALAGRCRPSSTLPQRTSAALRRQTGVDVPPDALFGAGRTARKARVDKVFLMGCHTDGDTRVTPVDPLAVAERMYFSLREEEQVLRSWYHAYRFAFPKRPNHRIERSPERQRAALEECLRGKEAYEVRHPYPVALPALFEAMSPYVG